jgi:hypothetical protein
MLTGCLILGPCCDCVVPQSFAVFLSLDVLLYGLAHQRVGGLLPRLRKPQQTSLSFGVQS